MGHSAHSPFITWAVQDEFIGELVNSINGGHDVLIDKSRDMGASWICLGVIQWFWQFRAASSFMELSRTEDYVDKTGSMDSLFEKHRYLIKWQPYWMRPRNILDNHLMLRNLDNGAEIIGESTTGNAGRGGRKTAVLCDEFAAVENGEAIDRATADTTACRIFNSTPSAGSWFSVIKEEQRARILSLHWTRHPEKGRGAHQILDVEGKPKWTSPWHVAESKRRTPQHMASEVDMDHTRAGENFFSKEMLDAHKAAHAKKPEVAGALEMTGDFGQERKKIIVARQELGCIRFNSGIEHPPLKLWIPLVHGRPIQSYTFVIGADISQGTGASNSVASIGAMELGQKVGEFASPFLGPEEFAEMVAWLGIWFGGLQGPAFVCWEVNGPGTAFGRKLVKTLNYPNYYRQRRTGVKREDQTERYGWHSNDDQKRTVIGSYNEALHTGRIINPSAESLDEASRYITDANGNLIPGKMRTEKNGARKTHGDRVIADALMVLAMNELPQQRSIARHAPKGTFAWRKREFDKGLAQADEWSQ